MRSLSLTAVMPRQRLPTADPQPTAPGSLLGVSEVAELAGISRQRAHVLTRRAGFPAPVVALKMGLVWRAVPVERWLAEYEKRKGTSPGAGGASPP